LEISRSYAGRELGPISAVLRLPKEAAEGPLGHGNTRKESDNGTWGGAREGNEAEAVSMTDSYPMTPPESHICLDR
jgi:hypothetical protein